MQFVDRRKEAECESLLSTISPIYSLLPSPPLPPPAVSILCHQGFGYSCPTELFDELWFTNQLLVNPLPTPTPTPSAAAAADEPLSFGAALATGTAVGAVGMLGMAFVGMHFLKPKRGGGDAAAAAVQSQLLSKGAAYAKMSGGGPGMA